MKYIILTLAWSAWCFMHSLLISVSVTKWTRKRFGSRYRYYRIFFNSFSIIALIPVLAYSWSISSPMLWEWTGVGNIVPFSLLAGAVFLFVAGGKRYDLAQVLGIRQARGETIGEGLTKTGGIDISGILGVVRHPWYTGAILLIWARDIDTSILVVNLVLTTYLVIGTLLEERKLVMEFGDEYRDYQRKVPMLIPFVVKKGSRTEN